MWNMSAMIFKVKVTILKTYKYVISKVYAFEIVLKGIIDSIQLL